MPLMDEAGLRIIAQRNGMRGSMTLGKSPTLDADDTARIAQMRTNRQARAVLGAVAQALQQGYQATVPLYARAIDKDSRELQRTMTSRLDQTNRWAQKVYAGIPDNDAPVSDLNRKKVATALAQTRDAVRDVEETAQSSGIMGALSNAIDQALHGAAADPMKALKWIGIGVVVLIGVGIVGKLVHTIMLGRSSELAEAEEAAVAIMDARRRKHR